MEIPDDVHQRGKAQASYRGMTWKDWVTEAIAEKVEREEVQRAEGERKRRSR
jgi:hypothetical protein